MSTASIKDHANTLLNLLEMERSPQFVSLTSTFEMEKAC
jgi:hypothetical protein